MKKINILDCTLRDGGYYNNWNFSKKFVEDYLKSIALSGIKIVEIGFRSVKISKIHGLCADVTEKKISKLKIPKKLKLGVMINASDVLSNNIKKDKFKKFLFPNNKTKLSFIRIACHFNEVEKILPYLKEIKNLNLKIILNLMQISEKPLKVIELTVRKISKTNVHVLYFADSFGSLFPDNLNEIIKSIKKYWKKEIGFHAHDNMGNAQNNIKKAVENGVTWIEKNTSIISM